MLWCVPIPIHVCPCAQACVRHRRRSRRWWCGRRRLCACATSSPATTRARMTSTTPVCTACHAALAMARAASSARQSLPFDVCMQVPGPATSPGSLFAQVLAGGTVTLASPQLCTETSGFLCRSQFQVQHMAVLASGSFGAVVRVQHRLLGKEYVIKRSATAIVDQGIRRAWCQVRTGRQAGR